MNRKLAPLLGVPVLAFAYGCNEATTAVHSPTPPSFQWQETLPPPPPLTVTIAADPNNPQPYEPGNYTFIASVSGGSGGYIYHWFWRGCNVNMEEEWCPSGGYWSSDQTGSSFTTYLGAYDTRLDVAVEVQDTTAADQPPSGKAYIYTPGPLEGYIGVVHGSDVSCDLDAFPLIEWGYNPNTGQFTMVQYRRNICNGVVEYQPD
jgi:hypothetical protein